MSDRPPPLEALRAQRKFMMYQIIMIPVGIGALILTAFVGVSLFRGKMTLEAATLYIMGTLVTATTAAVALGLKVIDTNTREDEARIAATAPPKGPSTVIAAGEGAKASSLTSTSSTTNEKGTTNEGDRPTSDRSTAETLSLPSVPVVLTESEPLAITPVDNPQKRSHRPE